MRNRRTPRIIEVPSGNAVVELRRFVLLQPRKIFIESWGIDIRATRIVRRVRRLGGADPAVGTSIPRHCWNQWSPSSQIVWTRIVVARRSGRRIRHCGLQGVDYIFRLRASGESALFNECTIVVHREGCRK